MKNNEQIEKTQDSENIADPATLTISDLSLLKAIIDIASSRGAFKPNEMIEVGTVYVKLESFLTQVSKQVEEKNV